MVRGLDGYIFRDARRWQDCAALKARFRRGLDKFPVAIARGKYLFPFRTEQSSPVAPMVLGLQGPGRVGRRRFLHKQYPRAALWAALRRSMAFPERIRSDRLELVRWRAPEHTAALAAVNADPGAVRFLTAGVPFTLEQSAAQSERFAVHWDEHGFGLYAVIAHGAVVGFTGVCHPKWFPAYAHEVEAGWRLHPSAWGNGYATEAVRAAVAAAFEHLNLQRILACIDPANAASIAVARRLQMTEAETVDAPDGRGRIMIYARSR